MVIKLLASILGISFLFNIIQFTLLDSCKVKMKVQNQMIIIANEARQKAIEERDRQATQLGVQYKRKIKAIESKKMAQGDYSCEQSLDLIISAMKEINNAPDNP